MNAFDAQPLPNAASEQDLLAFHRLALLAGENPEIEPLLAALNEHLKAQGLVFCEPGSMFPGAKRLVTVPLHHGERYLGDLCLTIGPEDDSTLTAARLEFFSPLAVLVLAAKAPLQDDLQQERDRLEAVLEATNEAILMLDSDGVLVMATPSFETFTGISRHTVVGYPVNTLAQQIENQPGVPERLANIFRALSVEPVECQGGEIAITEPQYRVLVWYSLPLHSSHGVSLGRIFVFHDVTRERDLDRMRIEFIALVTHELRTPLTSVKGFSDLILEINPEGLDSEVRDYLQIIAQNADRLAALIKDILDITRVETDRIQLIPDFCDVEGVIRSTTLDMQPLIQEHGHRLTIEIQPGLPLIWTDAERLKQITTNLLNNAIKYTLNPGEILIQAVHITGVDELPPAARRDQILPCVMISVADTGTGISPEDQASLFKYFYRSTPPAHQSSVGSGLGLMLVKALVEMQGGQVWFESTLGVGSTFFFTIPVGKSVTTDHN